MSGDLEQVGDDALQRLLDHERHADAVAARRRERSLRAQGAESGTLRGVLVDLAERRAVTSLSLAGGRMVRGVMTSVGADVVVVRAPAGETVLVALAAVRAMRTEPGTTRSSGDRTVHSSATMADLLAEIATEPVHVVLHAGTTAVAGELRAVGIDVATVARADRSVAYVALDAVTEVVLG